jgi:hypothetical protein
VREEEPADAVCEPSPELFRGPAAVSRQGTEPLWVHHRGADAGHGVDSGVAQNSGENAALELAMKWDHQRSRALVMSDADVAVALADDPAVQITPAS